MDGSNAGIDGASGFRSTAQHGAHVHLSVGDGCIRSRDCSVGGGEPCLDIEHIENTGATEAEQVARGWSRPPRYRVLPQLLVAVHLAEVGIGRGFRRLSRDWSPQDRVPALARRMRCVVPAWSRSRRLETGRIDLVTSSLVRLSHSFPREVASRLAPGVRPSNSDAFPSNHPQRGGRCGQW